MSYAISDLHNFKEIKKKIEIHTKFFNAEMKVPLGEGGRSTVLGDNVGSGWSSCGHSGCIVLESGFQLDCGVCAVEFF